MFRESSIERVTLGKSVAQIGWRSFWNDDALVAVTSLNTVPPVCDSETFGNATFTAAKAAPVKAMLMNAMGQVIAQQNFTANKGMNSVELSSNYRGPAMLMVRQGSQRYMQKVILK